MGRFRVTRLIRGTQLRSAVRLPLITERQGEDLAEVSLSHGQPSAIPGSDNLRSARFLGEVKIPSANVLESRHQVRLLRG